MKKYHFIAIGGIGMSGLAKYLLESGCEVSGSDVCDSKYIHKLKDLGAKISIGHNKNNLPEDCVVVTSTAIKEDNPELVKAKKLKLQILHRSDLLAELSKSGKFFMGYSGTHGKTTTSGLSSYVLEQAGIKPSFVVGGIVPKIGTNAKSEEGKYFIAELDESDGTILKYTPDICVINNLEADHVDFFKDGINSLLKVFEQFIKNLKPNSKVIINADCQGTRDLRSLCPNSRFITFGLNSADYVAQNIVYSKNGTEFDVLYEGELITRLKISIAGEHNVYNALAVAASFHEAGIDLNLVKEHFYTFNGMGRRFQKVGEANGTIIYDDYAHHPSEIKATLSSLNAFEGKNIVVVFQPHRYTRLQSLWNDFLNCFNNAHRVVVTDVYAASEKEIEGIDATNFTHELAKNCMCQCEHISGDMKTVANVLLPTLTDNDVVIGMGAGTITELGNELLKLCEENIKIGN